LLHVKYMRGAKLQKSTSGNCNGQIAKETLTKKTRASNWFCFLPISLSHTFLFQGPYFCLLPHPFFLLFFSFVLFPCVDWAGLLCAGPLFLFHQPLPFISLDDTLGAREGTFTLLLRCFLRQPRNASARSSTQPLVYATATIGFHGEGNPKLNPLLLHLTWHA